MTIDAEHLGEWRRLDGTPASEDGTPDLVLAHLSDLHGQLRPRRQVYFDGERGGPPLEFDGTDRRIERAGGVARLTAKLAELRDAHDVLTLMSGDTFHGAAHTTYTLGASMLAPVDEHLDPDVYVPGNWDFGPETAEDGRTVDLLESLDATVLANNLYDDDGRQCFDSWILESVGGIDVGVVGMTNVYVDRMMPAVHEGKYRFGKHPALLEESAREVRDAGADVVVAVTEIGLQWAVQSAKDCPSVDVHCSAHTHEYTHEPILVDGTLVVESGLGDALGRIDLRVVDGELQFRHHLYCLLEGLEYTPEPDDAAAETVSAQLSPFLETPDFQREHGTLETPVDTVVGETATPMDRRSFLESGWNTLFNDALRAHFDADLAVGHGYRYGVTVPPGEITLGDVYTCLPTPVAVASGTTYGKQLTSHLERYLVDNFSPHVYEQEDGRLRSFSSNVEVTVDPTAKRGRRLVEMRVDGETVAPGERYSVATTHGTGAPERVLGGFQYAFDDVTVETGTTPVDVVVSYLEDNSPVAYDGATVVRTADDGGEVQNTPADGPYPFVQPGVDYDEEYTEVAMRSEGYAFPEADVNRYR